MQDADLLTNAVPDLTPLRKSIVISVVLPAIAVGVLLRCDVPLLQAMLVSSIFPIVELVLYRRSAGRWDAIAMFSIVVMVVSLGLSYVGGDARVSLVKDSLLTAISGLVFLGSLLAPRPLIFFLSRSYMAGATAQAWDERWNARPRFRRSMIVLTAAWGGGLLLDAIARVALSLTLAPAAAALLAPLVTIAVFAALIVGTPAYVRRIQQEAAQRDG